MNKDEYNKRRKLYKLQNQLREATNTIAQLDGMTYANGCRNAEIKDLRQAVAVAYAMSLSIEHRIIGEK